EARTKGNRGIIGMKMEKTYKLKDLEQVAALAHPLRRKILITLIDKPTNVAQLAREFGEDHAKINYHVRKLMNLGLVRLIEKREKRGIMEKYYQAIAQRFTFNDLMKHLKSDRPSV
ncbi:MAG: ArsR/SmtB family transcription factor, partial [Candidatus Bipolaricaulia bacterium]